MATVQQLRQQAKARKIKGYSRMNKTALMSALGVSADQKSQPATSKKKASAKFETIKTSKAIAVAIAKKTGGNAEEIHAALKKKVQAAIDKKRRQLKKQGKVATQKDLRAAAIAAVKATVKGQVKAKKAGKPIQPTPKAAAQSERATPSVHPNFAVDSKLQPETRSDDVPSGAMIGVSSKDGNKRARVGILSSRHAGSMHTGNTGASGKATDPHQLDNIGLGDIDHRLKGQILGLTLNANHIIGVTQFHDRRQGRFTQQERTDAFTSAIAHHAKEGEIVVLPAKQIHPLGLQKDIAKHPISKHMTQVSDSVYGSAHGSALVGIVRDGKLTPLTEADLKRSKAGQVVRETRNTQFYRDVYDHALQTDLAQMSRDMNRPDNVKAYQNAATESRNKADVLADAAGKLEDAYLGRKPKAGVVKDEAHYRKKAEEWAKTQGFGGFGGVNGFTAEATKAHDIAHPITHEMIGMDSAAIHKYFGSILQKNGKPSLLGEEAIVNVAEHLSRGDSLEASIISGLRVARVLSRNAEDETDHGRSTIRTDEFRHKLTELAEKLHQNDNFNEHMQHIRKANRVSGTVTMAGNDFSKTASGG